MTSMMNMSVSDSDVILNMDNVTEATPKLETYSDHKVMWNIATGIICVEFIFAFVLNVIVIGLLLRNKKRNRMSFFVLHLAVSDFLMAVFYIFPVVIDRLLDVWLAGLFMCKLLKYLSLVVCFASTYMLVVLSVDRLYAVARPLSATRRGMLYKWSLILIAWIIAALLGIYDLVYAEIITGIPTPLDDTPFCEIKYPEHLKRTMILLFATTNVFIPTLLVGACYTTIVTLIWRRGRKGIHLSNRKNTASTLHYILEMTDFTVDYDVCTANPRLKTDSGIIHRAKVKTIKITFVVVFVFLLCWGPFTFYSILVVYDVVQANGSFFILMALAPLNSMANPVVYLMFNHRILCERRRNQRRDFTGTSTKTTYTTYIRRDSDWSKHYPMTRIH